MRTNTGGGLRRWLARFAVAAMVLGSGAAALAQSNSIQKVTSANVGESTVLTIDLAEAPAQPPVDFSTQSPARIAIDFFATGFPQQRANYQYGGKLLRSANVVQIADRTRVILDLTRPARYQAELKGKQYIVTIDTAPATTPTFTAPVPSAAQRANLSRPSVRNIDFRRGTDGAGRVVVDLASRDVPINVAQQGRNIVVDFLETALPESLRRRYDVTDFGTPVEAMRASENGNGTRLVIEPRGANWEYNSYQTDTQFVVEVRPVKEDPSKLISGRGYKGERLSLNFQNIDIRQLLQVFADFTNLNIITSDSVQGNLTLRLNDVPWDQALQIVMDSKGLASRRNGNVLLVAPRAELATKEKLELESQAQIADLEPLRTQVFQLNYQRADDVRKMLVGGDGPGATRVLSKRGSLTADVRTNQLFVSDIASKLEEVQNLLQRVDVSVRQVVIEARIVEADDRFSRNLGVRLGFADRRSVGGGNTAAIGSNYIPPDNTSGVGTLNNVPFLSLPANVINTAQPAALALSLFSSTANRFLNLELSALEADGRGKIISSPRVVTADNVKALIEQGTELPYQAATSSGATSVQFRKANLKLEVVPQITPEGNVLLDVDVNKDSVGIRTDSGFAIDTKHVKTQVLVENGGTVVIGGIFTQNERTDVEKVPFLGDIPVLGNLFKRTGRTDDRTELLIFLTPRVIASQASRQ